MERKNLKTSIKPISSVLRVRTLTAAVRWR